MVNHPNRQSINAQEAGAFVLHCVLKGLSTAQALAELAQTTWPDLSEDLAFGRRRHTPTIRRLAKPGIMELDDRHARARITREAELADRTRWAALAGAVKSEIRAAAAGATGNVANRAARNIAVRCGIVVYSASINALRSLIDPRQPWNI